MLSSIRQNQLNGDWRSILTREHVVCGELRHAARTRLVVWGLLDPWHVRRVCTRCGTANASTRGAARSVLFKVHQHFDSICSRLRPCRRVGSQPIHPTKTFELASVASNSFSIVPPVLWNVMMLPLCHTWPTDMIDLCRTVFLGAMTVTRHTISCTKQIVVLPVVN